MTSSWPEIFTRRRLDVDWQNENEPYISRLAAAWREAVGSEIDDHIQTFINAPDDTDDFVPHGDKLKAFCSANNTETGSTTSAGQPDHFAWLHECEYNNGQVRSRAQQGPLTSDHLRTQLLKPRYGHQKSVPPQTPRTTLTRQSSARKTLKRLFHLRRSHRRHAFPAAEIDSIPECAGINVSVSSDHTNEPDAQRRLIFITDLFPSMANALITSVSKHQAPALREALYKHLAAEASVGVTFPNKGFLTFRLSFHIPFFTLTSSQTRLDDQREVRGSPLRHTEDISFLSGSSGTEARRLLHEGHITCVIAGLDDEDWTAYLFIDTYFDGEDGENALAYQRNDTEHGMNEDPLTCGNHDADNPVCNPRRYFLDVLYYRLLQVKEEWQKVVEEVEVSFGQYERSPRHLLSRPDRPDDQEGVLADDQDSRREFDRVLQTMRLTTKLRARLTKTIDAFEAPRCDSLFGLLRELNQTESDLCHGSLPGIEASVGELKRLKKSLDSILDLGSQLGKIHGVILNLGALDETREQSKMAQKNGRFSGTMMASLPVALTTSVFSMQKIPLPLVRYSFGWFVGLIIMFSVLGTGLHYTQPMLQRRLATMAARQKPSFPKFNLPHFGRRPPLPGNDLERGDSQSLAPTNQADRQIVAIQPRRTTTFDSIATTLRPENPSAH